MWFPTVPNDYLLPPPVPDARLIAVDGTVDAYVAVWQSAAVIVESAFYVSTATTAFYVATAVTMTPWATVEGAIKHASRQASYFKPPLTLDRSVTTLLVRAVRDPTAPPPPPPVPPLSPVLDPVASLYAMPLDQFIRSRGGQ